MQQTKDPTPIPEELRAVTVKDASALLSIPRSSLYDLLDRGAIPCLEYGTGDRRKCKRILVVELKRFARSRVVREKVPPGS